MQIEHIIIIALLLIQVVMTIYYANYSNYESFAGSTKFPDMSKIGGVKKPESKKPKT